MFTGYKAIYLFYVVEGNSDPFIGFWIGVGVATMLDCRSIARLVCIYPRAGQYLVTLVGSDRVSRCHDQVCDLFSDTLKRRFCTCESSRNLDIHWRNQEERKIHKGSCDLQTS